MTEMTEEEKKLILDGIVLSEDFAQVDVTHTCGVCGLLSRPIGRKLTGTVKEPDPSTVSAKYCAFFEQMYDYPLESHHEGRKNFNSGAGGRLTVTKLET